MMDIPVEISAGAHRDTLEIVTDGDTESVDIQRAIIYILLDDDQGTPGFDLISGYTSGSIDVLRRDLNARIAEFNSQLTQDDIIDDISLEQGTNSRGRMSLIINITTKRGTSYNTEIAEYV